MRTDSQFKFQSGGIHLRPLFKKAKSSLLRARGSLTTRAKVWTAGKTRLLFILSLTMRELECSRSGTQRREIRCLNQFHIQLKISKTQQRSTLTTSKQFKKCSSKCQKRAALTTAAKTRAVSSKSVDSWATSSTTTKCSTSRAQTANERSWTTTTTTGDASTVRSRSKTTNLLIC